MYQQTHLCKQQHSEEAFSLPSPDEMRN